MKNSLVYGSVLNDASINKYGTLQFRQSLQKREYVKWFYTNLFDFTTGSGISSFSQEDPRRQKLYSSCGFGTRTYFLDYRTLLYSAGKKRLPERFADDIAAIALAVWFMDDGGKTEKAVFLTLDSFTLQEIECIQQVFREKFGIDTT